MRGIMVIAVIVALAGGAWMFRYEPVALGIGHQNRWTGAICAADKECW